MRFGLPVSNLAPILLGVVCGVLLLVVTSSSARSLSIDPEGSGGEIPCHAGGRPWVEPGDDTGSPH
jgi:hypothetical protein